MKNLLKISATIAAMTLAQASFAATASWTLTNVAPNVITEGSTNSNFWSAPATIPNGAKITSVSYNVGLYQNGATQQTFTLCWAQYNTYTYTKCIDVTNNRVAATQFFNDLNARGAFKLSGVLTGGTYPFYPHHNNSITVNYQY